MRNIPKPTKIKKAMPGMNTIPNMPKPAKSNNMKKVMPTKKKPY